MPTVPQMLLMRLNQSQASAHKESSVHWETEIYKSCGYIENTSDSRLPDLQIILYKYKVKKKLLTFCIP